MDSLTESGTLAKDCLDQIGPDADGLRWLTEYIVSCDH